MEQSRKHLSPDHTLRVLVRIDTRMHRASLEVRGCLTPESCATLMNILSHTGALGTGVSVNLLRAAHIEREALEQLRATADAAVRHGSSGPNAGRAVDTAGSGAVEILAPRVLPVCARLQGRPPAPARGGAGQARSPGHALSSGHALSPGHALSNEEAVELAFFRHDPRVLARQQRRGAGRTSPGSNGYPESEA